MRACKKIKEHVESGGEGEEEHDCSMHDLPTLQQAVQRSHNHI